MLQNSPVSKFSEIRFWRVAGGGWRQVYGSFADLGVSMEWHDFQTQKPLSWSESFHPGSLELCLNLEGVAEFGRGGRKLGPRMFALYCAGAALQAARRASERHRFLTIEMSPDWLRFHLAEGKENVRLELLPFLGGEPLDGLLGMEELPRELADAVAAVVSTGVRGAGRYLWMRGKMLEILAWALFPPGKEELFCTRHQRVSQDRVLRVQQLLAADLSTPPSLSDLATQVGCSSYYLSRLFSQQTGMTISRYLRNLRLEKAADLLRSGRYNVTEAAMEVGYSSLSHFSKAFAGYFGRCPCAYPLTVGVGEENVLENKQH
jgi:AraC family transcriptional regulator